MPATHQPISVYLGDSWLLNVTAHDSFGNPLDIDDATILWQLYDQNDVIVLTISSTDGSDNIAIVDANAGLFSIDIPPTLTNGLALNTPYYDKTTVTLPSGLTTTQAVGLITIIPFSPLTAGPSVYDFFNTFVEFAGQVTEAQVQVMLDLAPNWVDVKIWSKKDYPLGILYWTAHNLQLMLIQLASTQAGGSGSVDLFIRQISIGERRVAFGQRKLGADAKDSAPGFELFYNTVYGEIWLTLLYRNVGPVRVI